MNVFAFKIKIPGNLVSRFARDLQRHEEELGVSLSRSIRNHEDHEDSEIFHVLTFFCQAPIMLAPEQIIVLMALCRACNATVLGLSYPDGDAEDNESHAEKIHLFPAKPPRLFLLVDNTDEQD